MLLRCRDSVFVAHIVSAPQETLCLSREEVRGHNSQIENSTQLGEYFEKVNENSFALLSNFHEALRLYVFSAVSAVAKQVRVVIDNKTLFAASAIMKSIVHYFEECWERFYIFFLS